MLFRCLSCKLYQAELECLLSVTLSFEYPTIAGYGRFLALEKVLASQLLHDWYIEITIWAYTTRLDRRICYSARSRTNRLQNGRAKSSGNDHAKLLADLM
jgi:hypothetical protein